MNFKSLSRFCLFGLALVATVSFIGIRGFRFTSPKSAELIITAKFNCVHNDAPIDQPFEIEDKEEQTRTEDNEINEEGLLPSLFDSGYLAAKVEIPASDNVPVISKSLAEYHTPGYVRLRSILI
ncbi:MAG: hypothetical protein HYZ14_04385 [Bacteroidetes bacterium]|nr:hypothetical protein [Bacteroidota bacterium]